MTLTISAKWTPLNIAAFVATVVLVALKVTGLVAMSWWVAFSPMLALSALFLLVVVVLLIGLAVIYFME